MATVALGFFAASSLVFVSIGPARFGSLALSTTIAPVSLCLAGYGAYHFGGFFKSWFGRHKRPVGNSNDLGMPLVAGGIATIGSFLVIFAGSYYVIYKLLF